MLCVKNKYDVIHGVEEAGFLGAILARLFGAASIFEKHSDPFSYKKGVLKNSFLFLYSQIEKVTVRLSDAVIGTGMGLVDQVEQMGHRTRAFHIFDIPSSLREPSPVRVGQIRKKLISNQDEVLVTYVGSFALYQGVDLMFATFQKVIKNNPLVRFIIVGGTEEEINDRKKILEEQQIDSNVSFLGKVAPDILPEYLCASDILLSPRISGVNTPLKILDYMKAGKAIVATNVPSHRLLLDESSAVLANPEPEQLAKAISSLAEDSEKREEMSLRNRHLFETKYNFTHFREQLSNCYQYVIAERC